MSDSCLLPDFDASQAAAYARQLFALNGPIKMLDGERDLNFLIGDPGARHVFKIANAQEAPAMLECQHLVFHRLADQAVFPQVATARASINGRQIEILRDRAGVAHACRALPFVEGHTLFDIDPLTSTLVMDLGLRLAQLDQALAGFSHPALERRLLWRMDNALEVLAAFKPLLADAERRNLVDYFEAGYRARVLPRQAELRRAVIHNDANRANVLVNADATGVIGIIDFGDMIESWLVAEAAIAAAYVMLDADSPLAMAASLLRGYHSQLPLQPLEMELLFDFICMRLAMSVCINAHQSAVEPENAYLQIDVAAAWALLQKLQPIKPGDAISAWASALA